MVSRRRDLHTYKVIRQAHITEVTGTIRTVCGVQNLLALDHPTEPNARQLEARGIVL